MMPNAEEMQLNGFNEEYSKNGMTFNKESHFSIVFKSKDMVVKSDKVLNGNLASQEVGFRSVRRSEP
jgi:hypothetical protein